MSFLRTIGNAVQRAYSLFPARYTGRRTGDVHEPYAGAWQMGDYRKGESLDSFSAVYACTDVISSDISKLPMRVMQKLPKGGEKEMTKSPYSLLLRKPNRFQTSMQFLQHYVASKLMTGNVYVYFERDGRGVPNAMYVLDPLKVSILVDDNGLIWYRVAKDPLNNVLEEGFLLRHDEVLHDRMVTLHHPLIGVSPLYAAAVTASMGQNIRSNSQKFFENLARPSGILTAPGEIKQDLANRLRKELELAYSGRGFGRVMVLGSSLDWKNITMSAIDAQLIDQLKWTVMDVARVYRVPGFMIGEGNQNYRNTEQMARTYFQGCLSYHIQAIQQCFTAAFNFPADIEVKIDTRPLFSMETDLRYNTYKTALAAGIKSINEVRDEEGLEPVEGGEEPRVQAQYLPLSKANGEGVSIPGAPAPADQDEPDEDVDEDTTDDEDDEKGFDIESVPESSWFLHGQMARSIFNEASYTS